MASGRLEAGLSEGSMLGNPTNGGHKGPHLPQGTLFSWARCCGDAPGLVAPNTAATQRCHPSACGARGTLENGVRTPPPHTHIPFTLPSSPSPAQHPGPHSSTQHPARLSGQLSAFFFPVVSAGAWGGSGAEHPPRHPACPALPLPTTPSTQHRPGR